MKTQEENSLTKPLQWCIIVILFNIIDVLSGYYPFEWFIFPYVYTVYGYKLKYVNGFNTLR